MALEIERKFRMNGFPEHLKCLRQVDIEQGYISVEPEIRIHKAVDRSTGKTNYRLTVKGNGTLSRTEIKTGIEEQFYQEVVEFVGYPMICKDYRCYELEGHILEVCCVDAGTEHEFYYGEIEFESEAAAEAFVPGEFLGTEVTDDDTYKMKNYWSRTRLLR